MIDQKQLENVESFTYLVSILTNDENQNISYIAQLFSTTDLLLWHVIKMNHQLHDYLVRRVRKIVKKKKINKIKD